MGVAANWSYLNLVHRTSSGCSNYSGLWLNVRDCNGWGGIWGGVVGDCVLRVLDGVGGCWWGGPWHAAGAVLMGRSCTFYETSVLGLCKNKFNA